MVVVTMTVVMLGGRYRYRDASRLVLQNVRFEANGSGFGLSFGKCKNENYRQGIKALVAASPLAVVCPARLIRELQIYTGGSEDMHVFRGLN